MPQNEQLSLTDDPLTSKKELTYSLQSTAFSLLLSACFFQPNLPVT